MGKRERTDITAVLEMEALDRMQDLLGFHPLAVADEIRHHEMAQGVQLDRSDSESLEDLQRTMWRRWRDTTRDRHSEETKSSEKHSPPNSRTRASLTHQCQDGSTAA